MQQAGRRLPNGISCVGRKRRGQFSRLLLCPARCELGTSAADMFLQWGGVWHILRLIGLDTRGYSVVLWHVGSNVISDKYIRIGPSTIVFGQGIPVAGQVLTMSPMCSFRSTFNPCQNVRRGKNRPWHPPCTELPSQVNLSLWPMSKFWPRLRQTLAQTIGTITSTYAAKWVFPAQDPAVSIKIKRPRAKFNQKPRCLCRRPRVRRTCVVCLLSVARKRGKRGPTEPEYSGGRRDSACAFSPQHQRPFSF